MFIHLNHSYVSVVQGNSYILLNSMVSGGYNWYNQNSIHVFLNKFDIIL